MNAQDGAEAVSNGKVEGKKLDLKVATRRRAMRKLYVPHPASTIFPLGTKMSELYPFVGRTLFADQPLTYIEFGVFEGASLDRMAQIFTHPESRFIGFDSFEGLPEAWARKEKGAFSTNGKLPVNTDSRVSYVKGYFQNTLPNFLINNPLSSRVLVHFDADLYSSTLFLMTTLWHHLREYHFIFDEFMQEEASAMYDFVVSYPVEYSFLACTTNDKDHHKPQQLFGYLKKSIYKP